MGEIVQSKLMHPCCIKHMAVPAWHGRPLNTTSYKMDNIHLVKLMAYNMHSTFVGGHWVHMLVMAALCTYVLVWIGRATHCVYNSFRGNEATSWPGVEALGEAATWDALDAANEEFRADVAGGGSAATAARLQARVGIVGGSDSAAGSTASGTTTHGRRTAGGRGKRVSVHVTRGMMSLHKAGHNKPAF